MAGWGSTTDIGVSYNDKGFYVTSKLAYIQSFGLGEDADNFGLVLGAGKDWFIAEHWYAGGQLDLRWADTNVQDVGLGVRLRPYTWDILGKLPPTRFSSAFLISSVSKPNFPLKFKN